MALAIDGSAGLGSVTATTVISGTLTTTQANDVLVAVVFVENTANSIARTTTGVKLTTAGTAFTKYTSLVQATDNELSIWWLSSAGTIAQSITATASGTADDLAISVFGVSGANTSSPWDVDGPYTNTGTTNVAPSVSGVSAVGTANMLLGFCGVDYHLAAAITQTAGAMAGTTGILINSDQGSGGGQSAAEYRILSSAITSQSVAFGTAVGASRTWAMIAASIVSASGAAAPTLGWSRPSDSDRFRTPTWQADESRSFFRPSQIPVPNIWLPTTGEEDRPPPLKRPPDEPRLNTYFVQSPNPVPTTWLPQWDGWERPKRVAADPSATVQVLRAIAAVVPISGIAWHNPSEDKERPAPFKPTPGNSFFSVQIPTSAAIWLPTTGQEDRPPNPNRIRTDFAPQWFVRSPNPVPTTWLPQWDGWERPKPIGADPSGVAFSFKAPTVVSTIAGMAWFNPPETRLPPVSGDPYAVQTLPPFIEPPLQSFYAAANADDFNPLKPIQQVDAKTTWVAHVFVAPVGISGIAWWRPVEVLIGPYPPNAEFVVQRRVSLPPPPTPVSGIAWWRQTEFYPIPAPDYRDFHLSWGPQIIVPTITKLSEWIIRARRRGRR